MKVIKKRSYNKRGQMQMSETIAVLFIFFILILFGLIFYYKYEESSFKQKQDEWNSRRAAETSLQALFLPELICSKGNAEPEDNCIDMNKVFSAQEMYAKHRNEYFELFSYAKISLYQTYPSAQNWTLYEFKKEKEEGKEAGYKVTRFVVALKDETQWLDGANYNYGYLEVGIYT